MKNKIKLTERKIHPEDVMFVENLLKVNSTVKNRTVAKKWFHPYNDAITGKLTFIRPINIMHYQFEMPDGSDRFTEILKEVSMPALVVNHRKNLRKQITKRVERKRLRLIARQMKLFPTK